MNSSGLPCRRIASNYLFTPQGLLPHPLIEADGDGCIRSVRQCAEPDRCAGVEFYAGILTPRFVDVRSQLVLSGVQKEEMWCDFMDYGFSVGRIVEHLPRERRVILLHGDAVTQLDIDVIMNHFTAPVWWCLSPVSNQERHGLRSYVELLRRNRLNICLGAEPAASNHNLTLPDTMRLLPDVPLLERLTWVVMNGAEALGMNGSGIVESGARCGLNVISGLDYDTLQLTENTRIRCIFQ